MLYYLGTVLIMVLFVAIGLNFFEFRATEIDKLPKRFEAYRSLDSSDVITSGKVSMKLIIESRSDIQYFMTPLNQLIVYGVSGESKNVFYKFNEVAEMTDSLVISEKPDDMALVNGFILDKEKHQYYTWSFDGRSEPRNIRLINERFDKDAAEQQQILKNIIANSSSMYAEYDSDNPEPRKMTGEKIQAVPSRRTFAKITYFVSGDCYQFFTTLNVYKLFPYIARQELLLNNLFKRINTKVSGDKEIIQTPFIRYRYFQKLKKEKVRFPGGGGNNPGYNKLLFHGNLFTDLVYKNDTLRVKEFMYLDQEWPVSAIEIDGKPLGSLTKNKVRPLSFIEAYMYYTNPRLSYALFTNSDKKLYVIKYYNDRG